MQESQRIAFIDYVRVVACFLVMLVHSSEQFYCTSVPGMDDLYTMVFNDANRLWVSIYDGFIGRTCVPLFMVVSAFLLVPLKPGVTMRAFYARRFKRILPPMVCFLLIYTFLPLLWGGTTADEAWTVFKTLPFNFPPNAGHLWFLYPLISLYLIIPVVSPWLERADAKDERLFLCFFVASTFVPWLTRFCSSDLWGTCFWNPYFGMLYYCSGYLGYLVMAHYIRVHLCWSRSRRISVGAVCFLIGAAFTGWSFWHAGIPMQPITFPNLEWSWEFCSPNVLCATFGAFLMFTCIKRPAAPRWLTSLSKLTFGMYLMHLLFLGAIAPLVIGPDVAAPLVPVWLAIPSIAVLTFLSCAVTTKVLSLLPGSRWVIG